MKKNDLSNKVQQITSEIFKQLTGCKKTDWVSGAQMMCYHDVTYTVLEKNHCTTTLGYFILDEKIYFFLIHKDWSSYGENMKEVTPLCIAVIDYHKKNKATIKPYVGQEIALGSFCELEFELFTKITLVLHNHARHLAGKE